MKIAWLSDIHLNFLNQDERLSFYYYLSKAGIDSVVISGDIAEAPSVSGILKEMRRALNKPIYFVLGNHDYYRGQVTKIRAEMRQLTRKEPLLAWLPASKPISLKEGTYLLGQDGWADGRNGNFYQTEVRMNDSRLIDELYRHACLGKKALLEEMQRLADTDAQQLSLSLEEAIAAGAKQVIVLTHVPPFRENCFYRGQAKSPDYLPFYSSQATGNSLLKAATENPNTLFLALCGHTHGKSIYQPLVNLIVKTAQAEYFDPKIQEIISNL